MCDMAEPEDVVRIKSGSVNLDVKGRPTLQSLQDLIVQCGLIGIPPHAEVVYITVHQSTIGGGSRESSWTLNWTVP